MRSEIRDRNNKRDTSFKLACLTAGCRDFEGKRSEIRDRNNEHPVFGILEEKRSEIGIVV